MIIPGMPLGCFYSQSLASVGVVIQFGFYGTAKLFFIFGDGDNIRVQVFDFADGHGDYGIARGHVLEEFEWVAAFNPSVHSPRQEANIKGNAKMRDLLTGDAAEEGDIGHAAQMAVIATGYLACKYKSDVRQGSGAMFEKLYVVLSGQGPEITGDGMRGMFKIVIKPSVGGGLAEEFKVNTVRQIMDMCFLLSFGFIELVRGTYNDV